MKNGIVMHHTGNAQMALGTSGINVKYLIGLQHWMTIQKVILRTILLTVNMVVLTVLVNLAI